MIEVECDELLAGKVVKCGEYIFIGTKKADEAKEKAS